MKGNAGSSASPDTGGSGRPRCWTPKSFIPHILCDLLLRLAEYDVFRPLWSAKILEETVESILRRRPDLDPGSLCRRMDAMNEAFRTSVSPASNTWSPTMPEMGDDAHVLAALFAEADFIVTDNVKDFPPHIAPQFEIAVRTADQFLVEQWRRESRLVVSVLTEQSEGARRPHITPNALAGGLRRVDPAFVQGVAASKEFREASADR